MPEAGLPSGEVTFVFTDIEGSTRLLRALGERYSSVLARHLEILRQAADAERGVEVDAEGDAMFFAFPDAGAALRASLNAQRALSTEPWPDGSQVRVRMGVHTGTAAPVGGRYVALAVHQAARIAAAGHGGQIVFSDATLAAADDLTQGVLRDLGRHHLKDFDEPIRLWQLTAPGLPTDFPDLRTGGARLPLAGTAPHGLTGAPAQWTTFVGRRAEQRAATKAVSEARLVTLTGPGGVGKSRLAIEVAGRISSTYEHGGVFVDLVPVRPGFLGQAVAAALGVTARADQTLDESVLEHLATRGMLLVLDNCEHVLEEVADLVARTLGSCPRVAMLATSRERLGLRGERVMTVPPLPTDPAGNAVHPSEATRLFMDRVLDADPAFDDDIIEVAELCARLDGMPLAIELAAARAGSLGLSGLLAGLGDQLRLLTGGRSADKRHRSLRSVLDWSHGLLDDEERQFLHRSAIFVNGFDLLAAAEVASDGDAAAAADLLGRLSDKSLVVRQRGEVPRWRMLETIRTYALDKLAEGGDGADTRARHLRWATDIAQQLADRLDSDAPWRQQFDAVADDLRAAIRSGPEPKGVYVLSMATGRLAFAHRFYDEAQAHFERAAEVAPDPGAAVAAILAAADVCQASVRTNAAFDRLLRAADLAAAAQDNASRAICLARAVIVANRFPAGLSDEIAPEQLTELLDIAKSVAPPGDALVGAYLVQATTWQATGQSQTHSVDPQLAREALAAARTVQDPVLISGALDALQATVSASGQMRAAFAIASERMANLTALPWHDPRTSIELKDTLYMLNEQSLAAGELPTALQAMRRMHDNDIKVFAGFSAASKLLGGLVLTGAFEEAAERANEMWTGWLAADSPTAYWMAPAVLLAALAAALRGDDAEADEWLRRAQRTLRGEDLFKRRTSGSAATFVVARRHMHAGRYIMAAERTRAFGANAGEWYVQDSRGWYEPYVWALDAELAVLASAPDREDRLAVAAPAGEENRWAAACLQRARGRLSGVPEDFERAIELWTEIDARFERACTLLLVPGREAEGSAELASIGAVPPASSPRRPRSGT